MRIWGGAVKYGVADPWGYVLRNCTSYVAWKINAMFSKDISGWGNADTFNTHALAANYTDDASPQEGDIAQWDSTLGNPYGHAAYVLGVTGGIATYGENNYGLNGNFTNTNTSASTSEGPPSHWIHIGSIASDLHGFIQVDNSINAKATRGWGGWTQEAAPGNGSKYAIGGNNMMFLRGDGTAFAKVGQGGSWTQETNPGGAADIAVSSTEIFLIIGTDNGVYSQQGISPANWLQEVGPGNAAKIAIGGNNMMFLRGDGAEFAKTSREVDGRKKPIPGVLQQSR